MILSLASISPTEDENGFEDDEAMAEEIFEEEEEDRESLLEDDDKFVLSFNRRSLDEDETDVDSPEVELEDRTGDANFLE